MGLRNIIGSLVSSWYHTQANRQTLSGLKRIGLEELLFPKTNPKTRLRNVKVIMLFLVLMCIGITLLNIYLKSYIVGIIMFIIFIGFIYSSYRWGYKVIKKEYEDELISRL